MERPPYQELCLNQWSQQKLLCVGIDPLEAKLPEHLLSRLHTHDELEEGYFQFGRALVLATMHIAGAYKPNAAFYEAHGIPTLKALYRLIAFIHEMAPWIPVIYDAKRGDIGDTAACYARSAFEVIGADAITLSPYLGRDSPEPFLKYQHKGSIILCKTSNPGGGEFQDLDVSGDAVPGGHMPLYQYVAHRVSREWNGNGNCGLVVGATYPDQLREVRESTGDGVQILCPGIGKQGGDLAKSVQFGVDSQGGGLWINASSSINYAGNGPDFADKSRLAAEQLHSDILNCFATTTN